MLRLRTIRLIDRTGLHNEAGQWSNRLMGQQDIFSDMILEANKDIGFLQTDEIIKRSIMDNYKAYNGIVTEKLRAAVGKIHIFFGFSKNSTNTRYRPESAWGLYAGYGRDGWRMQKKNTERTNMNDLIHRPLLDEARIHATS